MNKDVNLVNELDDTVFKVQREQLAGMDLEILCRQVIDLVLLDEPEEQQGRILVLNLTFNRIKNNLVAGALAVAELEILKKS